MITMAPQITTSQPQTSKSLSQECDSVADFVAACTPLLFSLFNLSLFYTSCLKQIGDGNPNNVIRKNYIYGAYTVPFKNNRFVQSSMKHGRYST